MLARYLVSFEQPATHGQPHRLYTVADANLATGTLVWVCVCNSGAPFWHWRDNAFIVADAGPQAQPIPLRDLGQRLLAARRAAAWRCAA